jgi:aminopeptidase N
VKYISRFIFISYTSLLLCVLCFSKSTCGQPLSNKNGFTHQDTLRGTITPERAWWNVMRYNLEVTPDYTTKTIKGVNTILFKALGGVKNKIMQIDLQEPMKIDSITYNNMQVKSFSRNGNVYLIDFNEKNFPAGIDMGPRLGLKPALLKLFFSGKPRQAVNPPWDGGWIWKKDEKGRPWMSVACQGLGASVWYPCKDHQSDEPDQGAMLSITVPDSLVAVGNGKMIEKRNNNNGTSTWVWEVKNPINNYNIVPYIGKYVQFSDNYIGETEKTLSLDYWVLDYELAKAKKQFGRDVTRMIKAFEYWFGPYPFYEDGYKLVQSPHLGMEHQSATAYGNHFLDGYLGSDLSGSGWGMKWDYIIIHESGHEWFANNISTNDIADMWVHEGFTMYSEPLFIEYHYGKKAADEYVQGIRNNIENDKPVIGPYGVNQEGSADMYNKGANMLHTIRQIINDDTLFRNILRGLNKDFYHSTVNSKDVEEYISKKSGKDFSKVFDQYLRTIKIPELQYKVSGNKVLYKWVNTVNGFAMPVKLANTTTWLQPTDKWKTITATADMKKTGLMADKNFYVTVKKVK